MARETIRSHHADGILTIVTRTSRGIEVASEGRWVLIPDAALSVIGSALVAQSRILHLGKNQPER